ncbi:helix-turn-helix domain-containing protein [Candidatus Berkelbacteria bacterium]|nr:helix-turn-helix domain-containing protein [Candidatus Berkelbacteria bacterium]
MERRVRTTAGKRAYRWDYQELRYLVYILAHAKNFQEILNLFIDLHTPKEMSEIIRRVLIASYLVDGKTYEDISQVTGASPTTIARIQQKFFREKGVLERFLQEGGSFVQFEEKSIKRFDPVKRRFDILLQKASLGLLGSGDSHLK